MPAVTELPPLDQVGEYMLSEAAERRRQAEMAWRYYQGDHVRHLRDIHVVVNLWATAIDQAVSMLVGRPPQFELVEGVTTEDEEALYAVWQRNRMAILLHELALVGALTGHCFLYIWRDRTRATRLGRLQHVTVFWHAEDRTPLLYVHEPTPETRRTFVNLLDGRWEVTAWRRDGGRWVREGEGLVVPWRPVVDWQNLPNPLDYYGRPDLGPYAKELNDAVNFVASNVARILKYHAHPRTVVTGAQGRDIQATSADGLYVIPQPEARVTNLEMRSDLGSSLAFLGLLRSTFMSMARAVDLSTMKEEVGRLTNFGLRVLFHTALEKLETKRALYGEGLAEACRQVLLIETGKEARVRVHWHDPLPFNRAELVAALKDELDMGVVSRETAARELGRDWQVEQERQLAEAKGFQEIAEQYLEQLAQAGVPKV